MRHLALIILSLSLLLAPKLRAESELDLPMDLEKEQQKMETGGGADRQAATEALPGGAEAVPAGTEAAPAQGDGTEGPQAQEYAAPGDPGAAQSASPRQASARGARDSLSADDDFYRGRESLLGDNTEEDAPHNYHIALLAQTGKVSSPEQTQTGAGFDFQTTLSQHWSLGIIGLYETFSANDTTATAELFAPTLNYYSRRPYEGIWLQFSAGAEFMSAHTALPIAFSLGWRFLSDDRNLTFGIALGPRFYFFESQITVIPIQLSIDVLGVAWNIWPH